MVHDRLTSPSNIAVWNQTKLKPINNKLETVLSPRSCCLRPQARCPGAAGREAEEASHVDSSGEGEA